MPAPQTVHTPSLPIVTGVPFPWGAERYVQHFSFQKSFAETHVAQTLQINFFSLRLLLTLSSVDWNDVLYLPEKVFLPNFHGERLQYLKMIQFLNLEMSKEDITALLPRIKIAICLLA